MKEICFYKKKKRLDNRWTIFRTDTEFEIKNSGLVSLEIVKKVDHLTKL